MGADVFDTLGEASFAVVKMEGLRLGTVRIRVYWEVIKVSLSKGDVAVPACFQAQFSTEGPAPQLVVVREVDEADVGRYQTLDGADYVVFWLELSTQNTQ